MKTKLITLLVLLIPLLYCCEKSEDSLNIDSISGTKWTLSKRINNETGEIEKFPEQLDNLEIVFKSNGNIELLGFCNFSYGNYELKNTDSLIINKIGPSTLKYCLPDLSMNWEIIFATNFPNSKTFSINQDQLLINCDSEYDLTFDFVKKSVTDLSLIGKWKVIGKEIFSLDSIIEYPQELNSNLLIEFDKDSVFINGCGRLLGGCDYYTDENKITFNPLSIIEICDLNDWVELSVKLISHVDEYSLKNDTLRLISKEQQEALILKK